MCADCSEGTQFSDLFCCEIRQVTRLPREGRGCCERERAAGTLLLLCGQRGLLGKAPGQRGLLGKSVTEDPSQWVARSGGPSTWASCSTGSGMGRFGGATRVRSARPLAVSSTTHCPLTHRVSAVLQGRMLWKDGRKYDGEFVNGNRCGRAHLILPWTSHTRALCDSLALAPELAFLVQPSYSAPAPPASPLAAPFHTRTPELQGGRGQNGACQRRQVRRRVAG